MNDISLYLQFVFGGLTVGSIYGIVAIGFTLIYRLTTVLNFAQGEFFMLGAMLIVFFTTAMGLPVLVALALAIAISFGVGIAFQKLCIAPAIEAPHVTLIMLTLGAVGIFKGGAMLLWGKDALNMPAFTGPKSIFFLGAALTPQALMVLAVTILLALSLTIFLGRTLLGKAMRACAEDRYAARLMGIDVQKMDLLAFGLGGAFGAMAGALIVPITAVAYDDGMIMGMKGLTAAVMGGMTSYVGALVGGIALGLLESLVAGTISSQFTDAIAFAVLMLILLIRPKGLLGNG